MRILRIKTLMAIVRLYQQDAVNQKFLRIKSHLQDMQNLQNQVKFLKVSLSNAISYYTQLVAALQTALGAI